MAVIGLTTELWFGKYTGKRGREIAQRDPQYIAWMRRTLKHHEIDDALWALAVNVGILESEARADAYGTAADWGFE